jgi:hypothetical protein
MLEWAHTQEWDKEIVRSLPKMRRNTRTIDKELASLVYYNEDITEEERERRWSTLDQQEVVKVVNWCNAIALAPAPEGWHSLDDCQFTDEMFDSIRANAGATFQTLEHIPPLPVEKRRQTFESYWRQKRQTWEEKFCQEVRNFQTKHQRLGQFTLTQLARKEVLPRASLENWQKYWAEEVDQVRVAADQERMTIHSQYKGKCSGGAGYDPLFTQQYYEIQRSKEMEKRKVRDLASRWSRQEKSWRSELKFYQECANWVRTAPFHRSNLLNHARVKLQNIEKVRGCEYRELFPFTSGSESVESPESSDLNAAIMEALESHAVPKSPADYPSSRGIGDIPESTRPVQNQVKDWNILGTRGLEAVQMSSHRGPPTDRPPDIPCNKLGVFAGCSQERANTRRTYRLAFSHESHCSSGNASPLADNAFLGIRAIEQFRASAVGTSQRSQSGAELDASEVWSVQGQRGTCVAHGNPLPNLGRNLFPPRRFSYHTRFSRINGTAS